jgi:hypothetical protein
LTYAEIILPNDQFGYQRTNIIGMNNITDYADIDFKKQSNNPHVLISAKVERVSPLSRRSGLESDDDDNVITPIMTINKNDSTTVESFFYLSMIFFIIWK